MDRQDQPHTTQKERITKSNGRPASRTGTDGDSGNGDMRFQSAPMIAPAEQRMADVGEAVEVRCPRCGSPVDEHEYCSSCGLHLIARPYPPSGWTGNARMLLVPLIALIALVALGTGIYAIASQPQTTTLKRQMASLTTSSNSAQQQISILQSSVSHAATKGNLTQLQRTVASLQHGASLLRGNVGQLQGDVVHLQRGVGQLQGNASQLQSQTSNVLTCLPQLQQQIDGLNVKTTNVGGRLTSATLSNPAPVTRACEQTVFGV
jgi:prefoldin subunit 5